MADTASTTFPKSQPIPERSTRLYSATLTGPDGAALQPGQISSIKFSLRDDKSDVIVNDRNRIEVKNANGGTMAADGAFTMTFNTDDVQAIGSSKLQKRRALFEVTYAGGIENHEVFFYIENLEDLPPVSLSMLAGNVGFTGLAPTLAFLF